MKRIISIILALLLMLVTGCAHSENHRYQAEFLSLFDTVTTVVGYSDSEEHFKAFAEQVRAEIEEYHQLYDIYNDYEGVNNIKTINDNAGISPVKVDGRIIEMLQFAKNEYKATGGAVNVAFGAVLSIWHDYREAGLDDPAKAELPPMAALEAASRHTSIEDVVIDEAASTVFLSDPELRLDVGAVAKGYAVEQVADYFEAQGVTSMLLSIGGNIRAIGEKQVAGSNGEKRWTIGIQNPDKASPQTEIMSVLIDGMSVVSSGVYERYYTVDGVQYHHIIDPATLMPATYFAQVTLLCRDSGQVDALSTAVFNMPLDEGISFINGLKDVEAAWVMKDGSIEYSAGFQDYLKT